MDNTTTVKAGELATITGRTRDVIRNMINRNETPWDDDEFPKGAHRRYSGQHALALVLAEMMTAQGVSPASASEVVRMQRSVVARFLDEVEAGADIQPRFIALFRVPLEDSWVGARWLPTLFIGTGTPDELVGEFARKLAATGKVTETRGGKSTERQIGGPTVALASLPEAYRLAKMRAEAEGFIIDGRRILKLDLNRIEASE